MAAYFCLSRVGLGKKFFIFLYFCGRDSAGMGPLVKDCHQLYDDDDDDWRYAMNGFINLDD